MTYYPDLSTYEYFFEGAAENTVNIGWLDPGFDFPQGKVSERFLDRLWAFCRVKVLIARGFHLCEFCDMPRGQVPTVRRGQETLEVGFAEIRVFGRNGKIYAAPNLIYHYVTAHHYRPPDEFVQAVLEGVQPDTPDYENLLRRYDWYEEYWSG